MSDDRIADFRADIARAMIPLYRLAPLVGLHPSHLGQVLLGRRPLTDALAARIEQAINDIRTGKR